MDLCNPIGRSTRHAQHKRRANHHLVSTCNAAARSLLSRSRGRTQTAALTFATRSEAELAEFPQETIWYSRTGQKGSWASFPIL